MITNKIFVFVIIFIHCVLGLKFEFMFNFIQRNFVVVSISIQHDISFNLTFLSLIDDLYELFVAHKIITLGEPYN